MCSKLLRHERQHGVVYNVIERGIGGLTAGYRRLLGLALRMRFVVVLIGLVVAAGGGLLLTQLKSELAPIEDQGTVVSIFQAPQGATIDYTEKYAREQIGRASCRERVCQYV